MMCPHARPAGSYCPHCYGTPINACPNCGAPASALTISTATIGANGAMIPGAVRCARCENKPADPLAPHERAAVERARGLGRAPELLAIIDRLAPVSK